MPKKNKLILPIDIMNDDIKSITYKYLHNLNLYEVLEELKNKGQEQRV